MPSCTLHKWPERTEWGLPSISPACIQAEAYLRFSGAEFEVQPCTSTSKSPAGQLPALERNTDVAGCDPDEFAAARAVIAYAAKNARDLDSSLTAAQRAELYAFVNIIRTKLEVATEVCTWLEPQGYFEYKKAAYGSTLPFPLNYVVPWSQQRMVRRRYGHLNNIDVYEEACEALSAIANRLRSAGGRFFFGARPSSLDALLVGHLAFYRSSPAAAPVLCQKVASESILSQYVEHILETFFSVPAPLASNGHDEVDDSNGPSSSWSEAAKGTKTRTPKVELTPAELALRRRSWYWLAGAGTAVAAYIVFSGRYPALNQVIEALGQDNDPDDDGTDDDDDGDE